MKPIRSANSLRTAWKRSETSFGRFVDRLDRERVPYLSHSKIDCLERCPGCYYRQYILGECEQSNAMELGLLFHLAAKNLYTSLRKGLLLKPAQLLNRKKTKRLLKEDRLKLMHALTQLSAHHWAGYEITSIEELFFMELAAGLPPIIGITDIVLRRTDSVIVVDHKTSKSFNNRDPAQLVLYAEHIRRQQNTQCVVGVFDEYRLVPDLAKIRKPAFRRTPVSVDRSLLPALVRRYRQAWKQIQSIDRDGRPEPSPDCWKCNSASSW